MHVRHAFQTRMSTCVAQPTEMSGPDPRAPQKCSEFRPVPRGRRGRASCWRGGMTHSRHAELKAMLEARKRGLDAQVHHKIRAFRDMDCGSAAHAFAETPEEPSQDDIDFA